MLETFELAATRPLETQLVEGGERITFLDAAKRRPNMRFIRMEWSKDGTYAFVLSEGDGRVEILRDYGANAAGSAGGFLAERSSDLAALLGQARAGILDG